MNNEEEKKESKPIISMTIFFCFLFYVRFFLYDGDSTWILNYCLIVLGLPIPFWIYKEFTKGDEKKKLELQRAQAQAQAKADELRAEQEAAAKKRARQQEINRMINEL